MVAAAVIGSAVVGAGVGIYSSNKAAKTEANAASNASAVQQKMYDQTRQDLAPYRAAGQTTLPALNNLLTGDPAKAQAQLEALPGYQFTRDQGLQAVQNSAAARGLGTSGAALRGAADYTTGLANGTFGDQVNRLQNFANMGQNAAAQTGAFAIQTGNSIGNNIIGAGNAQAAGIIGSANALSGAAGSVGNLYLLNALSKSQGGKGLFG